MFVRVIEHVLATCEKRTDPIDLENLAISKAWYDSNILVPSKREPYSALPGLIDGWCANVRYSSLVTDGRRQGPLLRQTVDRLKDEGVSRLFRNEIDLLLSALEIIRDVKAASLFQRLSGMLCANEAALKKRREAMPPIPGLTELNAKVQFVTGEQIAKSRTRSIRNFAGIHMPCRGPIYSHAGDLKVLDDVLDETMLVIEDGSCWVGGFVLGRLATSGHCEVRENISGVVIAREGNIRARSVINNAFVVSKWGGAKVRSAEQPRLFFAGKAIEIKEKAVRGKFAAPEIRVGEEISGGHFTVSKSIEAGHFRQTHTQRLSINLHRRVSANDYGEIVSLEAGRLLAGVARRRQRRDNLISIIAMVQDECEHRASSSIMFLLGGEGVQKKIEDVTADQRRLSFLNRVIAGIDGLTVSVEDQLIDLLRERVTERPLTGPTAGEEIDDLVDELTGVDVREDDDQDLRQGRAEIIEARRNIRRRIGTSLSGMSSIKRLREKKVAWLFERERLVLRLERNESAVTEGLGRTRIINMEEARGSKLEILSKVTTSIRKQPHDSPLQRQLNSNFIRMMMRSIESRLQRQKNYINLHAELEKQIEADYKILQRQHNISSPDSEGRNDIETTASGHFESGITLCTELYVPGANDVSAADFVVTRNTGSDIIRYLRTREGIREVPIDGKPAVVTS